jgi:hypothetical protein
MELRESVMSQPLPFCNICQEFVFVEWSTGITPCEHTFCQECIKEHVGVMLQENRFPVDCPDCLADPSIEEGSSKLLSSSQKPVNTILLFSSFQRYHTLKLKTC